MGPGGGQRQFLRSPDDGTLDDDWAKIPHVHSNINKVATTLPVAVYMFQQLQMSLAAPVPCHHGTMEENAAHFRIPCLRHFRYGVPWQFQCGLGVMLVSHQVSGSAGKPDEYFH